MPFDPTQTFSAGIQLIGTVSSSLPNSYDITNNAQSSLSFSYDFKFADLYFEYSIPRVGSATFVGDLQLLGYATGNLTFEFELINDISSELYFEYDFKFGDLYFEYSIPRVDSSTFVGDLQLLGFVGSLLSPPYDIINSVSNDFQFQYEISPQTRVDFQFTYSINVTTELTFEYSIFVGKDLPFSYDIIGFFAFSYSINNSSRGNLLFKYNVNVSGTSLRLRTYIFPSKERMIFRGFAVRAVTEGLQTYYPYRDSYGLTYIAWAPTSQFPTFERIFEEFTIIEL